MPAVMSTVETCFARVGVVILVHSDHTDTDRLGLGECRVNSFIFFRLLD